VLLVNDVKVGKHRIKVYEDDEYCYFEVLDENGKVVENLSTAECGVKEFYQLRCKYEQA